jgi:MoaA/NifB/PqqE/SkfB family radical SAM enzyme
MAIEIPKELKDKLKTIPKKVRMWAPYKVHWNWDILFKCNYKCSYCEVIHKDSEFNFQSATPEKWKAVWDRIFDLYWCTHIRFSGGEPTIYPKFLDFLGTLLEKHTADITTNLSFNIDEFFDKVKPGGLSISASFHPEFGGDFKTFFEKLKRLHFNGFPSTVSYVGYPPHLDKIAEYKQMLEAESMYFKIIPFIGKYKGKKYPDEYTPEERRLLEGFAKDSKDEHLNDMNSRWYEWRVERPDEVAAGPQNGPHKFTPEDKAAQPKIEKQPETLSKIKLGKPCRMGQMYAKIHPDLNVTRCCAGHHGTDSGKMGSILDDNFLLNDDAPNCLVNYDCPCFKGMFVGDEEDKWEPLWEALDHPVYKLEYIKEYIDFLKQNKTR